MVEAGGATLAEQMAAVEYAALVCTTRKPILDAAHATLARAPAMEAELDQAAGVIEDRHAEIATLRAQLATAQAEIERLRGERDILVNTFTETCDEIGCAYDNEAALMAVAEMKAEAGRLREALAQCEAQFRFYQSEHEKAGKMEKAATNQRFADLARAALTAALANRDGG